MSHHPVIAPQAEETADLEHAHPAPPSPLARGLAFRLAWAVAASVLLWCLVAWAFR